MRTEWMQGYIDALNQRINCTAYEDSKEYKDGYDTALAAELNYVRLDQGENDDF